MKVINTKFEGLKIIQQKKHGDSRGNLRETFRKKKEMHAGKSRIRKRSE